MSPKTPKTPVRTRLLSGRAKSRYVRSLLERNGASPDQAATADEDIVQVHVRRAAAERLSAPTGMNVRALRIMKPVPLSADLAAASTAEEPTTVSPPEAAAAPFNPFAYSAMAVLLNEGRRALEARLALVTSREQIVQLAEAQSVRLDPAALAGKKTSLKALRGAFIDAVEKRIAHRRAVSG
jgi:hypothetical protein